MKISWTPPPGCSSRARRSISPSRSRTREAAIPEPEASGVSARTARPQRGVVRARGRLRPQGRPAEQGGQQGLHAPERPARNGPAHRRGLWRVQPETAVRLHLQVHAGRRASRPLRSPLPLRRRPQCGGDRLRQHEHLRRGQSADGCVHVHHPASPGHHVDHDLPLEFGPRHAHRHDRDSRCERATLRPLAGDRSTGPGRRSHASWTCQPNVEVPAGTYTIVDSEPATWSQNPQSGGRGMAVVAKASRRKVCRPPIAPDVAAARPAVAPHLGVA